MGKVLTLAASARGRAATEGGGGFTLLVDGDDVVTVEVIPEPRVWLPQGVTLLRNGVALPRPSFGTTWSLTGELRFGTYVARATEANGSVVESAPTTVVPALAAVPAGAGDPGRHAGRPGSVSGAGSVGAGSVGAGLGLAPATGPAAAPASAELIPVADHLSPDDSTPPQPHSSPSSPPSPVPSPPSRHPATGTAIEPDPTAPPTVISIPLGEYDGRFSAWTAALFALLAGALLLIVAFEVLPHFNAMQSATDALDTVGATQTTADGATSEASPLFARRLDAVLRLLITTVGILLLLAGAAMAALETRARLQRSAANPVTLSSDESVSPEVLDKVPAILERASVLRGTTLVLLVGASLLLLAMCAPSRAGEDPTPEPGPSASAPAGSSTSPSASAPTPSPNGTGSASPEQTPTSGSDPTDAESAPPTRSPATTPSPTAAESATPTR